MPWTIREIDGKFCVCLQDSGEQVACHATRAEAEAHMRALYANVKEAEPALAEGSLLENTDGGAGWRWRVQVIQAGVSRNRTEYPLAVLHRRSNLYEGVPVFAGPGPDHNPSERGFGNQAGWITAPRPNPRGVEATLEVRQDRDDVRAALLHGWEVYQRTHRLPFGLSHVVPAGKFKATVHRLTEGLVRRIDDFEEVASVDLVMRPSAGGELLGLIAAMDAEQERSLQTMNELLERRRRGERLTEAEDAQLRGEVTAAEYLAALPAPTPDPTPAPTPTPAPDLDPLRELRESYQRELEEARRERSAGILERTLGSCRLPEPMVESVRADFSGRAFEPAELTARVERERGIWAKLIESQGGGMPRSGRADVTQDQRDKHRAALDGFLGLVAGADGAPDRVMPWWQTPTHFRSLKEAVMAMTGRDNPRPESILAEAVGCLAPGDPLALRESVTTATFAQAWADALNKRLIAEYAQPDLNIWRDLVSNFSDISSFVSQKRVLVGGYGNLPGVNEGGTYQPLTTFGDDQVTYSVAKYGGLEELTMESIANDDMGVVREIPSKLGQAAQYTLRQAIFTDILVTNPDYADGAATDLFHADHGNLGSTAIALDALTATRNLMRSQLRYGTTRALGLANVPRFLWIPGELEATAFELCQSSVKVGASNATPNYAQAQGLDYRVVDEWTDVNNWYLTADPGRVPILEVGFFQGRQDPELFVQDAPAVGSTFSADKITYKIRHIWGVVVLDYRGMYRHTV